MPSETLTIVDNRTGREYSLPIVDGAIRATDLAKIIAGDGDGGLLSYDPAYLNTSSCRSAFSPTASIRKATATSMPHGRGSFRTVFSDFSRRPFGRLQ